MTRYSLKDYVKRKFENEIFLTVQKYVIENCKNLDLRLYKVQNINKIRLSDTTVKFISANDLSETKIEFDVTIEAELEVLDYFERYERCGQWFVLKCTADLGLDLDDLKIDDIDIYTGKSKHLNPLSDYLVPIISGAQLESCATEFLHKYYPEALRRPMPIEPNKLAERMGLKVIMRDITKDFSIFGQICFYDCTAEFYDKDKDEMIKTQIDAQTIVVDEKTFFFRNIGSVNNTIVHECVHWDKHRKALELERLHNKKATRIKCKVSGGIKGRKKDASDWMEWQANALTPKIQMPLKTFRIKAQEYIKLYTKELGSTDKIDIMETVIDQLAAFFSVSRASAKIRMIEAGYEEAIGTFTYIDGHYVKPHSFKKGTLKNYQTFSIGAQDAAILSKTDFELNALISDGSYQYVEAHFVLNHSKYLTQNESGKTILTRYAITHMDECCLIFDLSVKSKCNAKYYNECFLNRDNASGIDFNIVFKGGYEFADKEKKNKILKESIIESAKIYNTLPNCYRESLKKAFEWKGVTYTELEKKTGMSEKTIRRIISGETKGTCESMVLICLGLHLPPKISKHIIQNSPCPLCNGNSDHNWYDFALTHLYSKSIEEIKAFFDEYGVKQL